ncbi:hypothetical protein ACGF7U_30020 [Micromonospora sp. NPDC047670]|uniref:hypothetical protein n=1 Tax=Micromonospora sp. NPDC047670 TaxID=3364252 RepID=UPI00371023D5
MNSLTMYGLPSAMPASSTRAVQNGAARRLRLALESPTGGLVGGHVDAEHLHRDLAADRVPS